MISHTVPDEPVAMTFRHRIVARLRAAGCVFAEEEARLLRAAAPTSEDLADLVDRRVAGVPLEYVLGWVDFCGRRIALDEGVFIPRRRTQLLARTAARYAAGADVVVDLCCGCGAIAEVVQVEAAPARLLATDLDPRAVANARRNLEPLGAQVTCGDLFAALPDDARGGIDVLVANVPYVPTGALRLMPVEARDYEPRMTHDGGTDGLDVLRRVARGAGTWLRPGGRLLSEVGDPQLEAALDALRVAGLSATTIHDAGLEATVVVGCRCEEDPDA